MGAILFAMACAASPSAGGAAITTSYHIGNSLTWDSQPLSLAALAAMRGLDHDAGYHVLSGSSLQRIVDEANNPAVMFDAAYGRYFDALPNHAWSAVTMQPHSNLNSTLGTDVTNILGMIDLTRSNPANAETTFYIYAAWPPSNASYQQQWTASVPDDLSTPTVRAREYFTHLINRVRAATDADVRMIPVGEVLYTLDARMRAGEAPGYHSIAQFYRDSLHLSEQLGRYTAAVTTFATIRAEDPRGLTRPDGFFTGYVASEAVYPIINQTIRDVLTAHEFSGVSFPDPLRADFDGDGMVDGLDLDQWRGVVSKSNAGDATGDSAVDGADFLAWQRRIGFDARKMGDFDPADVNLDGLVDTGDLGAWNASFGIDNAFDVDNDGDTDGGDFLLWQRAITERAAEDLNHDGVVDHGDLAPWTSNFGYSLAADANGDRAIDGADFLAWQREVGRSWPPPAGPTASGALAAVPEPAARIGAAIGAAGVVLLGRCRRSQQKSPG